MSSVILVWIMCIITCCVYFLLFYYFNTICAIFYMNTEQATKLLVISIKIPHIITTVSKQIKMMKPQNSFVFPGILTLSLFPKITTAWSLRSFFLSWILQLPLCIFYVLFLMFNFVRFILVVGGGYVSYIFISAIVFHCGNIIIYVPSLVYQY